MILSGPSNSGKSTICYNLIRYRNEIIQSNVNLRVRYHIPINHKIYAPQDLKNEISFFEGLPEFDLIDEQCLIIIDDFGNGINNEIVDAFTRFSHHKGISIVLVTHNLFPQTNGNLFRTASLNSGYFLITKNYRNKQQIGVLATQIHPQKRKSVISCFEDAIKRPYGYLCVDCTQETDDALRWRTNIFPSDPTPHNVIYLI